MSASTRRGPGDLGLLVQLWGASLRGQLAYRSSLGLTILGRLVLYGVEFGALALLFQRFDRLAGWTLAEVALLYGLVNAAFALCEATAYGFERFGTLVRSGELDRALLRPRPVAVQVAGHTLDLVRAGRLASGLVVLGLAARWLELSWSPAQVALVVGAVLGGACLFAGIMVLQGTLSIWTVESLEVAHVLTYGGVETAQYPLEIYTPGFRRFFTWVVPLACVNYLPTIAILGRPVPAEVPGWLPWAAPLVGPLFLLVALRVFAWGLGHYRSTGS